MNMDRTGAVKEAHFMEDVDNEEARGWSWRHSRQCPATCVHPWPILTRP